MREGFDKTMDFLHFVQSVSVDELEEMVETLKKDDNFTIAITNNEEEHAEQSQEEEAQAKQTQAKQTQAEQTQAKPSEEGEGDGDESGEGDKSTTTDKKPQGELGGGVELFQNEEKKKKENIELTPGTEEEDGGQHEWFLFNGADKINVLSDGNCAYHAISLGLAEINSRAKNNEDVKPVKFYKHQELRKLVEHVNLDKYNLEDDKKNKYIEAKKRGSKDEEWAQNEEFEILAEELGICFVVYRIEGFGQNDVKWQLITPLNDGNGYCGKTPKIYILNSGGKKGGEGTHFELLYNLQLNII